MSPQIIALILELVEETITQAPAVYADLQALFANNNPTAADWDALRSKLSKTYADYVPQSALPPTIL